MFEGLPWYVYALIAALLVAVVTLLEKKELKHEHSLEYVVVLSIFNLVVATFLWPWVDFSISGEMLLWLFGASIFGSLSLWFVAKALRHLDVSVVAPQMTLSVVFALVFAYIFLGETVNGVQAAGIVILLGGSLILTREALYSSAFANHAALSNIKKSEIWSPHFYQMLLLAAMALLGASTVVDKMVLGNISVFTFTFFIHVFLAFNHLVIYGVAHKGYRDLPKGIDNAGWLIVIIAVLTLLSRLALAEALAMASVALVIPLKRISSVITTVLGGKLFGESGITLRTIIAIVMVVGVWLIVK